MSRVINNSVSIDLSQYNTVFCDSIQALDYAYKNGLSESAIIKTSSPAMLWNKNPNIQSVDARWTRENLAKFQESIERLSIDVFDNALSVDGIERELALVISQYSSGFNFQKVLYKAACLSDNDFTSPRLFIHVNGKTGPAGNIMNSPWERFLLQNKFFSKIEYTLKDDEWQTSNDIKAPYWKRIKVAGYETIAYRAMIFLLKKLPNWFFSKNLLMPNENELNIEIAFSLLLRGVKVSEITPEFLTESKNMELGKNITPVYDSISPIIRKRVEKWVVPSAVEVVMKLFKEGLEVQLKEFELLSYKWEESIVNNERIKQAVLTNSPGNVKGRALAYVCRKRGVPIISSQHGVTLEISEAHSMRSVVFDNSTADILFSYNSKIVGVIKDTYFNKSKHYVVGMPMRLTRMNHMRAIKSLPIPIVYISGNLYSMGFSISLNTDYQNAIDEKNIITKVLGRLPHRVRYKTYPEDNRRYSDTDPVLSEVDKFNNIELFSEKVDMRYLISEHRIFVTTCATSTLSWPVMSGKPVIFINNKYNHTLTGDAYISLAKGLFVFDGNDEKFHKSLSDFLSQPISEIEKLWKDKESDRKKMIQEYFNAYSHGAGSRAAKIIYKEFSIV
jgi:hypothetical protein